MKHKRLTVKDLSCDCDVNCLDFETTAELTPLQGLIAQERATKAIDFGLAIKKKGYNVYVAGSWGTGRTSYVMQITEKQAANKPIPRDWLYVNNFENSHQPKAISLKAGTGKEFVKWMEKTVDFLKKEIQTVFSSKDYENTKNQILKKYQEATGAIIEELNEIGQGFGFRFSQNERGLVSIPLIDGEPMTEEVYRNISDEEYDLMKVNSEKLSLETIELFNKLREEEEIYRKEVKELDGQMGHRVVSYHMLKIIENFEGGQKLEAYLEDMTNDIVEHIDHFKAKGESMEQNPLAMLSNKNPEAFFDRYKVNLFVDNTELTRAPIRFESNPSFSNLIGAIEYKNEFGVMRTDFTQIKAGALHEANGGFLILHAKDLLQSYYSWRALKRALLDEQIAIEGMGSQTNYVIAATLKPEPIPLDVKVIIIGDAYTYYLLYDYDEEFRKLFKIEADFDVEMLRNDDNMHKLARFISKHCEEKGLKAFDKTAVGRVVQYSTRLSESKDKMSTHLNQLVDVLIEADAWAEVKGDKVVSAHHVNTALEEKKNRTNKYEEKVLEMFEDGTYLIDVDGEKIGEINGLAVVGGGQYSFGKPSKITVSTFRGQAGLVNIEREARRSGGLHDKGVMIISGYLGHMYAQDKPLSLTATIVFEQLYSGIEGDSASSTELYAILSSLSGVPINQSIAVTGSVNQRGEIQPIGGVNEKIEGYYHVCRLKGLTGRQGVIIPHQNVKNLLLAEDVIEAVKAGMFHIYAVESIDEGIEILTGVPAGKATSTGGFTRGSIHYRVNQRIKQLAKPIRKRESDVEKKDSKEQEKEAPVKKTKKTNQ
ncbi:MULTISPECIES: Lon protease family protein [unclassified Fusibacter]|uniref:Lon protease family protein n=1 Tax=unclassified Fusibacter TaxID=2624464 RepID=UPI001011BA34|nr:MULTISPECIES: AAA family ATPase [unclassified Fusibacter]MCK8060562.1 AAA family ATPase [Fusibacter sp. A2]NPE22984.1 AAA family ATPase [Fusibacter sp. A1]RXV60049.1 ATP-dependent protease [Fusibacter sp. A1]